MNKKENFQNRLKSQLKNAYSIQIYRVYTREKKKSIHTYVFSERTHAYAYIETHIHTFAY